MYLILLLNCSIQTHWFNALGKRGDEMQNYSPNVKAAIGYIQLLHLEIPQLPTNLLRSKITFCLTSKGTEQREAAYFGDVLLLADQSQPFQWTPGMTQGRMETLVTPLANGVEQNTDSDVWLSFFCYSLA